MVPNVAKLPRRNRAPGHPRALGIRPQDRACLEAALGRSGDGCEYEGMRPRTRAWVGREVSWAKTASVETALGWLPNLHPGCGNEASRELARDSLAWRVAVLACLIAALSGCAGSGGLLASLPQAAGREHRPSARRSGPSGGRILGNV